MFARYMSGKNPYQLTEHACTMCPPRRGFSGFLSSRAAKRCRFLWTSKLCKFSRHAGACGLAPCRLLVLCSPRLAGSKSKFTQMPGITKLATEYSKDGLNVLLFPTDQV